MMKNLFILLLFLSWNAFSQSFIGPYEVSENTLKKCISFSGRNSTTSMHKPYVLLVSIDGYRYDYSSLYYTENLSSMEVKAEKMIPAFPTKTFPNHYSIITGLYPGNHGLVSNTFYSRQKKQVYKISDRDKVRNKDWYYGTPLWVSAQQDSMVSASMFWVGSEAAIQGVHPNYYFEYDEGITDQERINTAVNWLNLPEEVRPHFITLYFEFIDKLGHDYGPDSKELKIGVERIDQLIGDLKTKLDKTGLPVNLIIVSDHGMVEVDNEDLIDLKAFSNENAIITSSLPVMIYSEYDDYLDKAYHLLQDDQRVYVYKKDSLPEHFHYSIPDRIGDLVMLPKPGYLPSWRNQIYSVASHGFDPMESPEMGAIFYAAGPAFKKDLIIPPFENIHVYPLIANILGLKYDPDSIDGDIIVLEGILISD